MSSEAFRRYIHRIIARELQQEDFAEILGVTAPEKVKLAIGGYEK